MKSIEELKKISDKRIILRADLNVPIKDGKILDDFRIKKTIPTILYLQKKGAKIVIISHLGKDGSESMLPVFKNLKKSIENISFISDPILSYETEKKISKMKKGEVVVLENLRKENGEKNNAPSFARSLSRYADIYVNDAFSVCHREHASVVGLPKLLPSYAGFQLQEEIKKLSEVFKSEHPFLFIQGGAKFETKIPLIKKFTKNADHIFIGGALANTFFKVLGYPVGVSLVDDNIEAIKRISKNKKIIIPKDVLVTDGKKTRNSSLSDVKDNENIVDAGSETVSLLKDLISKSKFILWNGPLGIYENGFDGASKEILKFIIKNKVKTVIGGGDIVAVVSKMKLDDKIGFVSTGGGATLEFLAKGTLPGIRALK